MQQNITVHAKVLVAAALTILTVLNNYVTVGVNCVHYLCGALL